MADNEAWVERNHDKIVLEPRKIMRGGSG